MSQEPDGMFALGDQVNTFMNPQEAKSSGFAIASLCCGIAGILGCCTIVPSLLGIVFGAVSLGPIGRGEAHGKGMAVTGIVLGVIGLILGIAVWIVVATSPVATPIPGRDISESDRQTLETAGIVEPDDEIILLCSGGVFNIEESGALITENRLVVYGNGGDIEFCLLAAIEGIDFTPGQSFLDQGIFLVEPSQGDLIYFTVTSQEQGDSAFHSMLVKYVNSARKAAGKSQVSNMVSVHEDDSDD